MFENQLLIVKGNQLSREVTMEKEKMLIDEGDMVHNRRLANI